MLLKTKTQLASIIANARREGTTSRYIDADKLKDYLKENLDTGPIGSNTTEMRDIYGAIDRQPTVPQWINAYGMQTIDTVPVVHAHWIRTAIDYGNKGYIRCSNCGAGFSLPVHKMRGFYQRYCGSCGAKMDEANE